MYVRRPLRAAGWGTRRPGGMLFKRQAVRAILPSLPPPRPPRPARLAVLEGRALGELHAPRAVWVSAEHGGDLPDIALCAKESGVRLSCGSRAQCPVAGSPPHHLPAEPSRFPSWGSRGVRRLQVIRAPALVLL